MPAGGRASMATAQQPAGNVAQPLQGRVGCFFSNPMRAQWLRWRVLACDGLVRVAAPLPAGSRSATNRLKEGQCVGCGWMRDTAGGAGGHMSNKRSRLQVESCVEGAACGNAEPFFRREDYEGQSQGCKAAACVRLRAVRRLYSLAA